MAIDFNSSSAQQALLARDKITTQKTTGTSETSQVATTAPVRQDTVELSDTARALKAADEQIANTPDIDSEKVARLKAAIEDGSYQVDAERVAGKMLDFDNLMG